MPRVSTVLKYLVIGAIGVACAFAMVVEAAILNHFITKYW